MAPKASRARFAPAKRRAGGSSDAATIDELFYHPAVGEAFDWRRCALQLGDLGLRREDRSDPTSATRECPRTPKPHSDRSIPNLTDMTSLQCRPAEQRAVNTLDYTKWRAK